jgi:UDP-2,3-diacylglucosamine pyrophosphatase LpxH
MKLIWITDAHLEFVSPRDVDSFLGTVARLLPDAVLFTGDISVASRIERHLTAIATTINCQVYFVLGNHDFYGGSFDSVKAAVTETCGVFPSLNHLGHGEIVSLDSETVLIGHGGWADGRAGNGLRSTVQMNDFIHINDLLLERRSLFETLERLGRESADYISEMAPKALAKAKSLIVATHVPPFVEASLFKNRPSEPDFAPHFVNVSMGSALLDVADAHLQSTITVLCGHTHHEAHFQARPNLVIRVGGAEYGSPKVTETLDFHAGTLPG